jgi:hypothetical protein
MRDLADLIWDAQGYKFFMEYADTYGQIPPPVLLELGVKFTPFETFVKEVVVPWFEEKEKTAV